MLMEYSTDNILCSATQCILRDKLSSKLLVHAGQRRKTKTVTARNLSEVTGDTKRLTTE